MPVQSGQGIRGHNCSRKPDKHPLPKAGEIRAVEAVRSLQPLDVRVAGIDVGSRTHLVAALEPSGDVVVRSFECFTPDLLEMAQWLKDCQIESVVMESTGVYWTPVYQVLEDQGLKPILVDARYSKNLPGRKKTDVHDSAWLRTLHSYGLMRGCFIPGPKVQELRAYTRHRARLVEDASRQILLMHKALEQMNIQLHKVLSDITGQTGMAILRAILAGERDAVKLASLRRPGVHSSPERIARALTGHWREEHLFALGQAVSTYDFIQEQTRECDRRIQQCLQEFESRDKDDFHTPADDIPSSADDIPEKMADTPQTLCEEPDASTGTHASADERATDGTSYDGASYPAKSWEHVDTADRGERLQRAKRAYRSRKGQPPPSIFEELERIAGVDLCQIDGISGLTCLTAISEIGPSVEKFHSAKAFCNHLGLCPNNRITGGRRISGRSNPVASRLAHALRVAAQTLHHSKSSLGAFYRHIARTKCAAIAITATARKLACLIYSMLKYGHEYVDRGEQWRQERVKEAQERWFLKKAKEMVGYTVVNLATGEVVS